MMRREIQARVSKEGHKNLFTGRNFREKERVKLHDEKRNTSESQQGRS